MTDDKRPREFWLTLPDGTFGSEFSSNTADHCAMTTVCRIPTNNAIHVIEKSAYDALAKENETLKQTLKHDVDKIEAGYASERDQLKAHAEKLAEAADGAQRFFKALGATTTDLLVAGACDEHTVEIKNAMAAYRKDFPSE